MLESLQQRLLQQASSDERGSNDGPIAVLIVVCVLFCFIWTPMLCHRQCRIRRARRRQEGVETASEIILVSLRNLNLLGLAEDSSNHHRHHLPPSLGVNNPSQGMSLDDRRDFIKNILVSRKIIKVSNQGPPSTDDDDDDDDGELVVVAAEDTTTTTTTTTRVKEPKKTTLLLADVVDVESTTKYVSVEPCPICLNDYKEGDILCWSQNSNCVHCFHRDCMEEWLLRHEECPCCRTNYLSLDGDGNDAVVPSSGGGDELEETNAFLRGIHLFYLLSRLQSLADTRPNTTIRLEGVELANGRRGNLEIQRATDNSLEVGGRGLNVRVEEVETDNGEQTGGNFLRLDLSAALQTAAGQESAEESDTDSDSDIEEGDAPSRPDP